jgi:hypothetical protein
MKTKTKIEVFEEWQAKIQRAKESLKKEIERATIDYNVGNLRKYLFKKSVKSLKSELQECNIAESWIEDFKNYATHDELMSNSDYQIFSKHYEEKLVEIATASEANDVHLSTGTIHKIIYKRECSILQNQTKACHRLLSLIRESQQRAKQERAKEEQDEQALDYLTK